VIISDEWFTAFSITKNWNDMTSSKPANGDIPSPHGIRFLNMIMLIISHKCMELDFNPIQNRTEMILTSKAPGTVLVRASYLYTDIFLMLSAMLTTYSFVGRLQRGQKINYWKEVAGRYFRVVPPMAALIIFGTFILPILGSGPQWNMLITEQSLLCKQNWWRNFLMIHNWFGFENICMTHTHHIGKKRHSQYELHLITLYFPLMQALTLSCFSLHHSSSSFCTNTRGKVCSSSPRWPLYQQLRAFT